MKKLFLIAVLVLCSGFISARAIADEECLSTCTQRGYGAQFCQEKCAGANPLTSQQSDRREDPLCMSDCTGAGHESTYCNKACAY